jgi:mRNA interferase RelE/StbE
VYTIEISPLARRQFKKLPANVLTLIAVKIDALSLEPYPDGVVKLKGEDKVYCVRVQDYRIVYEINENALIILVLKIGHRREVYR